MEYIGIVGARKYRDRLSVERLVATIPAGSLIVTSGCIGVCQWTREAAARRGIETIIYAPDLSNIRSNFDIPKRYHARNRELIERCDFVHAFLSSEGGYTGGTRFEIEYAAKLRIPVRVHYEQGSSQLIWQQSLPFDDDHFTAGWQEFFASAV